MKEEIAELLFDGGEVVLEEGVGEFVGLFDSQGTQGLEGLLAVPGAPGAQFVHDVEESADGRELIVVSGGLARGSRVVSGFVTVGGAGDRGWRGRAS